MCDLLHRGVAHKSMVDKDRDKEIDNVDCGALYFDLVYNQNGSSSLLDRLQGKKETPCAGNCFLIENLLIVTGR